MKIKYLGLGLILSIMGCVYVTATPLSPETFASIESDSVRIVLPSAGDVIPSEGCTRVALLDAEGSTKLGAKAHHMFRGLRNKAAKLGANVLVMIQSNTDQGFFDNSIESRAMAMHCDDTHLPPRDE